MPGTPAAVVDSSQPQVMGQCLHTYQSTTPSPTGPTPTPVPMTLPFQGAITGPGSATVMINKKPAAVMGDNVKNNATHPATAGAATPGPALPPATNMATLVGGSTSVLINKKPAIRTGDKSTPTCGLGGGSGPAIVKGASMDVLIG